MAFLSNGPNVFENNQLLRSRSIICMLGFITFNIAIIAI